MAVHPFWKIACAGLSVWATLAACQQAAKKAPVATATASPSPTFSTTPNGAPPPGTGGTGVPGVGGVVDPCDPTDTKVSAACASVTPSDTRCATKPLPADLCEKVKTALAAASSGTDTSAGKGSAGGKTCTVNVSSSLALRDKPSKSGSILKELYPNDTIKWLDETNGWVHAEIGGVTGYACDTCKDGEAGADYLQCSGGGLNLLDSLEPEATPWPRSKATNPDGSFG